MQWAEAINQPVVLSKTLVARTVHSGVSVHAPSNDRAEREDVVVAL